MVSLGQQITNEQIAEMIREADVDGDGKINFVEFCNIMIPSKAVHNKQNSSKNQR